MSRVQLEWPLVSAAVYLTSDPAEISHHSLQKELEAFNTQINDRIEAQPLDACYNAFRIDFNA